MVAFADKLTIDTPEQITLEYEIAGPGSRFMALFVDLMIQFVAIIAVVVILLAFGVSASALIKNHSGWPTAIALFAVFAIQWGYFAGFEIIWKGQTPGKRQAGIRVINESGREASVYEAVARNLVRSIDSLPGPYAVGAVVMFISPQNKRLGDYVAGTIVVHDRKPDDGGIFFNTKETDITSDIDFSVLTTDDLHLIETFLQRRLDIPLELRQNTADKLAEILGAKCSVDRSLHSDSENLLEIMARGFRLRNRYRS